MSLAELLWRVVEVLFVICLVCSCIVVLSTLLRGGLHDVDTRGPTRRFPK